MLVSPAARPPPSSSSSPHHSVPLYSAGLTPNWSPPSPAQPPSSSPARFPSSSPGQLHPVVDKVPLPHRSNSAHDFQADLAAAVDPNPSSPSHPQEHPTTDRTHLSHDRASTSSTIVQKSPSSRHHPPSQADPAFAGFRSPTAPINTQALRHLNMSSASTSFSPISNHRHSSLFGNPSHHHSGSQGTANPRSSQSTGPPASATSHAAPSAPSFATSLSSLAVAAAGDTLRPAYLDESALSPGEYAAYLPALLSLKQAPSGLEGLYDELSALHYLRDKCKLQLKDEALILALFERTPLGIKPGHFYAWLRLVSWVQQGQAPGKKLLFSQTSPAQTFIGAGSGGRQAPRSATNFDPTTPRGHLYASKQGINHETPHHSSGHTGSRYTSMPAPSGRHAGVTTTTLIKPKARMASRSQLGLGMPSAPTSRPEYSSRNPFRVDVKEHALMPPPPAAPPTTHVVAPTFTHALLGPPSGTHHHYHKEHHHHHRADRGERERADAHHTGALRGEKFGGGGEALILHHAAPALPAPAPPPPPRPGQLPLDALIGFNPAPNPFKQTKPRLVRPTPVVATSATNQPSAHAATHPTAPTSTAAHSTRRPATQMSHLNYFDAQAAGEAPATREAREDDDLSLSEGTGSDLGLAGDESHLLYAGFKQGVLDRLGAPLPTRAPISPLIQAGLNAASQVHRAKQALPPKTYTTIQRSNPLHGPSKLGRPTVSGGSTSGGKPTGPPSATGPPLAKPASERAAAGIAAAGPGVPDPANEPHRTTTLTPGDAPDGHEGDPPIILAPQPRHATTGRDLNTGASFYDPPTKKKAPKDPDSQSEDPNVRSPTLSARSARSVHSVRSSKSKRSSRLAGQGGEEHTAAMGELLGTHLATLGVGGRPKSRLSTRGKAPAVYHYAQPPPPKLRSNRTASGAPSVPQWLKDQDRTRRVSRASPSRQSRTSRTSRTSSWGASQQSHLSPTVTRYGDRKSPATTGSVTASSVAADNQSTVDDEEELPVLHLPPSDISDAGASPWPSPNVRPVRYHGRPLSIQPTQTQEKDEVETPTSKDAGPSTED